MRMTMIALIATLGIGAGPVHSRAAQQKPPALASATHLKCAFNVIATGTWAKDGTASAEVKKADLSLEYRAIDAAGGSAEAVGWSGTFFITARFIAGSLHLLAIADTGPVYLTTVFNRPGRPGKYKAVHTRHELTDVAIPGFTSTPEQYIGECELLD